MTDKLNLQRLDYDPRLPMRGSIDFERVLYVRLYELFRAIAGVTNQNGEAISDAISNVTTQLTEDINQAIAGVTNQIDSKASKSANLSDLTNASTARDNLGLGTAATADIVGTVENGAIIERGSNENGEYVKYADGTQICSYLVENVDRHAFNTSGGIGVEANPRTWTYPATFSARPAVSVNGANQSNTFLWGSTNIPGSISVAFRILAPRGDLTYTVGFSLLAVGRWL